MNQEQAKKLADAALEQLAEALRAGQSDALIRYLDTLARFHSYSFGNVMLIASQKPDATHVAGFQRWKKLGRHVRKGEHGIAILAPLVSRKKKEQEPDGEDKHDKRVFGFRVVHVFDVSQTDGKPLPEFAAVKGEPGEKLQRLKTHIESLGISLVSDHIPGGALGMSEGGTITVALGLEPAEEFSVLAHEAAHELLHKGEQRAATTKTIRETEAEAVAYVVCHAAGLDTNTAAADYIQLYQGDDETLMASLDRVQKTAAGLIAAVSDDSK